MSEIEFRAWHKPTKTMHRVLVIDWLNQLIDLDGGLIEQSFDDVVIEQYTGIDDLKGKPIYEGDIVCYLYSTGSELIYDPNWPSPIAEGSGIEAEVIGKVVMWPSVGVMMTKIVTTDPEQFECDPNHEVPKRLHVNKNCEVIGNMYENPELLEAAK